MIRGHLTICKVYKDGSKEVVMNKHNLITAGLGSSFIDIIQHNGSHWADDYRPRYFQVGTSSMGVVDPNSAEYDHSLAASSYFYQLSAPLHWSSYGDDTTLSVEKRNRGFNASTEDNINFEEILFTIPPLSSVEFSSVDNSSSWFPTIPDSDVTKVFFDSFEAEIILDENAANGNTISEIGMFAKNPKGWPHDTPLLIAYKPFQGIAKTAEFSLVFHWSIGFLGGTTIDRTHYGSPEDNLLLFGKYSGWGITKEGWGGVIVAPPADRIPVSIPKKGGAGGIPTTPTRQDEY